MVKHGSYRFDDLLFKDFSRTFQGLSTIFKESISTRTISHFSSYSKKAISVSANNVIQPKDRIMKNYSFSFSSMELNFLSKETRSLSLSFADRLKAFAWVNKFYTSQLLRATFTSWFHLPRGGLNNAPGIPQRRRGYLDTLNKKH